VHGHGYAFCGVVTADAPPPKPAARRRVHFRLTWEGGDVPLAEGENVLGRVEEAAAWVESASVSRRHARILVSEGAAQTWEQERDLPQRAEDDLAVALADADDPCSLMPMVPRRGWRLDQARRPSGRPVYTRPGSASC
jgi:hypothetical protein